MNSEVGSLEFQEDVETMAFTEMFERAAVLEDGMVAKDLIIGSENKTIIRYTSWQRKLNSSLIIRWEMEKI
jgi:hypothetical protein